MHGENAKAAQSLASNCFSDRSRSRCMDVVNVAYYTYSLPRTNRTWKIQQQILKFSCYLVRIIMKKKVSFRTKNCMKMAA